MKKKNLKLGRLNLSKSRVASLGQSQKIIGGGSVVGPTCSFGCPPLTSDCPPAPSNNCGTQFPECQATDGFSCGPACNPTEQNCVTQQSCDPGGFLCEAGGFGGLG